MPNPFCEQHCCQSQDPGDFTAGEGLKINTRSTSGIELCWALPPAARDLVQREAEDVYHRLEREIPSPSIAVNFSAALVQVPSPYELWGRAVRVLACSPLDLQAEAGSGAVLALLCMYPPKPSPVQGSSSQCQRFAQARFLVSAVFLLDCWQHWKCSKGSSTGSPPKAPYSSQQLERLH